MILNWTLGFQRELWRNAALEVRYVGNRGNEPLALLRPQRDQHHREQLPARVPQRAAQPAINLANGRDRLREQRPPGPGAAADLRSRVRRQRPQPALAAASRFTNADFITQLQQGRGRAAGEHDGRAGANNFQSTCAGWSATISRPARRADTTRPDPYPINFFQTNPFAAGNAARLLTDDASTKYDSLQMQFRQRYHAGLTMTLNYTYGKARTDRYDDQRRPR